MDQGKGQGHAKERVNGADDQPKRRGRSRSQALVRILIVPFLLFISLLVGLMIGYSGLGHGPASDVFNLDTFKHMYDLIFSGTVK